VKLPSCQHARPKQKMHPTHHLRRISRLAGGILAVSAAAATGMRAQNLPATPPTALPSQVAPGSTQSPGTPQPLTPAPDPPRHAEIIITHGLLQIRADNSSLNQILRSISHITGMKITGGVEEQRVFGNYGPAPLSTILATLLDGTGANILLLGGSAGNPPTLVLTPRAGGPEPPGPNSPAYAMYDDSSDRASRVAPAAARPPVTTPTPAASTSVPAASVPPPAAGPAKVLTPEMVMQELQQMQAQQDQQKKALDQKIQQEQAEQQKKLNAARPQNPPTPPPATSNPQ
jgi:hypothetical protein